MTTSRDFATEMTLMISEELNAHRGDDDAYMANMERRVSEDEELLNFLTRPSLRSVIARWTREYQSSERFASDSRPYNKEALDNIEDGGHSAKVPRSAAIMTRTNGRAVLTKSFLDQYRYGRVLKDWVVCDLREMISGRIRSMSTEKRELGWMGKICDVAEIQGGSDKVKIGDHIRPKQVDAILKGEDPKPRPHRTERPESHPA